MDPKLDKWIRWLKIIQGDIQALVLNKDTFWEVQKIIRNNKAIQKQSYFYKYFGDTYVSYIAIGIRRQIKVDNTSISFARLLNEITANPELLSRAYYKDLYVGSSVESYADRHFDNVSGGKGSHINVNMVKRDIRKINHAALSIEDFTDKRIAHHDKRSPKKIPLFREVNKAVNILDKTYVKYHLIFHAESLKTLLPVHNYEWKIIFTQPWLKRGEK